MTNSVKNIIAGVLLAILGSFIVYQSISYYLKDIFLFSGIFIFIFGFYLCLRGAIKLKFKNKNSSKQNNSNYNLSYNNKKFNNNINSKFISKNSLTKKNKSDIKLNTNKSKNNNLDNKNSSNNSNNIKFKKNTIKKPLKKDNFPSINSINLNSNPKFNQNGVNLNNSQVLNKNLSNSNKKNLNTKKNNINKKNNSENSKNSKFKTNIIESKYNQKMMGMEGNNKKKRDNKIQTPLKPVLKPKKTNPINSSKLVFTPNYDKPTKILKPQKKSKFKRNRSNSSLNSSSKSSNSLRSNLLSGKDEELKKVLKKGSKENLIDELNGNNSSKSYVLFDDELIDSDIAFERLVNNANDEVLIESNSIKDLSNKFLNILGKLNTRIIVQNFDLNDVHYVLLLSSLLNRDVPIKTLDYVNTTNIIVDDDKALIITESGSDYNEMGALFTDYTTVHEIKDSFEESWSNGVDLNLDNY